jgi:catechol 2,3-dioxygenase-like lactoylglutathione lyase family enzyme
MTNTLSHSFIYVHDQDEALAFYTGPVGLEVRTDAQLDFMRWLTVGSPEQPEVEIVLLAIGAPLPPADHEAVAQLVAKGSFSTIFKTDDVDATFERLRAAGAEVIQEPTDQPYSARDCAFRDPSGNSLRFSQPSIAEGPEALEADREADLRHGQLARPEQRLRRLDPRVSRCWYGLSEAQRASDRTGPLSRPARRVRDLPHGAQPPVARRPHMGERGLDRGAVRAGVADIAAEHEQPAVRARDPLERLGTHRELPADRPPAVADHRLGALVHATDAERHAVAERPLEVRVQQLEERVAVAADKRGVHAADELLDRQRPSKRGARFSTNAVIASGASCVPPVRIMASHSACRPSAMDSDIERASSRRISP